MRVGGGLNCSRNGLSCGGSSKRLLPLAWRWTSLMVLVPVVLSCPGLWPFSFSRAVVSLWRPFVLSSCSLRSLPAGFGDGGGECPAAAGEELAGAASPGAVQHPERPAPAVSPVPGMGLPGGTVVSLALLTPFQHLARHSRYPEMGVCLSLLHHDGYRAGA